MRFSRVFFLSFLAIVLLFASILKAWATFHGPRSSDHFQTPALIYGLVGGEGILACLLIATAGGLRWVWAMTLLAFSLFAVVALSEVITRKLSCGCFGRIEVQPVYTLVLDMGAVGGLLWIRPADKAESEELKSRSRKMFAIAVGLTWAGTVVGMWVTRPVVAVAVAGQMFGTAGELVVLEPENWAGQRFTLAEHMDVGNLLKGGVWTVLLVHHDCGHCAAEVNLRIGDAGARSKSRLAVVEMPPFASPGDVPLWTLPAGVVPGRMDETRDWFASTPVVIELRNGVVASARDASALNP